MLVILISYLSLNTFLKKAYIKLLNKGEMPQVIKYKFYNEYFTQTSEDITLKSLYEKVEEPVITHTPTEWTKNNVTVSITSDHSEYKYLYKIDNG